MRIELSRLNSLFYYLIIFEGERKWIMMCFTAGSDIQLESIGPIGRLLIILSI